MSNNSAIGFMLFTFAAFVAAFIGWLMNIYKLVSDMDAISTTEAIIRGVGVIAAPLGAIAGYF